MSHDAIINELDRQINYAVNSHSRPLIYKAQGMVIMAYALDAITHDEYISMDRRLIHDAINNPEWFHHPNHSYV